MRARVELARPAVAVDLAGRLDLFAAESGLVHVRGSSHLTLNAILPLLRLEGLEVEPGLDGGRNYLPDSLRGRERLLELQCSILEAAVSTFKQALEEACCSEMRGVLLRVWHCEVHRDLPVNDAAALAESLATLPFPGRDSARTRWYARPGDVQRSGAACCVRWSTGPTKKSPAIKAYAKAANRLRIEVMVECREAVQRLLGTKTAPLKTSQIKEALSEIAGAAQPYLDEAEALILARQAPAREPLEFLGGLAPLLAVINPPQRRGRPPSRSSSALAYDVAFRLLSTGYCTMPMLKMGSAVRSALDKMADDPAGILERSSRRRVGYATKPHFEEARQRLWRALAEPYP